MSVDAGSFIEPSFLQSCVGTHAYDILPAIVQIFGNIVGLCGISARLMAEVESVDPHLRVAEDSVELQPDVLAVIL